jgi:hypothetical protein
MSDYLWDKSGEADPEVERLEEMFKGLRYQPRELLLPETEAPVAQSSRRRYWPGMAVAASLLLMGLAGLWLGQHSGRKVSRTPELAAVVPTPEIQQRMIEGAANPGPEKVGPVEDVKRQAQGNPDALPRHVKLAKRVGPRRTERDSGSISNPTQEVAVVGPERQSEQQAEGLRAKERLMLALQVASATLNHAQRKTRTQVAEPSQDTKPSAPESTNPWNKSR